MDKKFKPHEVRKKIGNNWLSFDIIFFFDSGGFQWDLLPVVLGIDIISDWTLYFDKYRYIVGFDILKMLHISLIV